MIDCTDLNEKSTARLLCDRYGDVLIWCKQEKTWYRWSKSEGYWLRAGDGDEILDTPMPDLCVTVAEEIAQYAYKEGCEPKLASQILTWANACKNNGKIKAIYKSARRRLSINVDRLDADPMLLNCRNGIVNLENGKLYPPDKAQYATKQVPFDYSPDSKCPVWENALDAIFGGEKDLTEYFQRIVGYGITADVSAKAFFVLYGPEANNGKTALINTLSSIFGDYSLVFNPTTLQSASISPDKPRSDLMRFQGKRVAFGDEINKNKQIDAGLFKRLTGGSGTKIIARNLFKQETEFPLTTKMLLATNHVLPLEVEAGEKLRLHVLPMETRFVKTEEEVQSLKAEGIRASLITDPNLQDTLIKTEAPGILRWAVEGSMIWKKNGLNPPEQATKAKDDYLLDCSPIDGFLEECCVKSDKRTQVKDITEAFQAWCKKKGRKGVPSSRRLTPLLEDRGIGRTDKTHGHYYYEGIELTESVIEE